MQVEPWLSDPINVGPDEFGHLRVVTNLFHLQLSISNGSTTKCFTYEERQTLMYELIFHEPHGLTKFRELTMPPS